MSEIAGIRLDGHTRISATDGENIITVERPRLQTELQEHLNEIENDIKFYKSIDDRGQRCLRVEGSATFYTVCRLKDVHDMFAETGLENAEDLISGMSNYVNYMLTWERFLNEEPARWGYKLKTTTELEYLSPDLICVIKITAWWEK
jgi:hypothetical protein